MMSIGAEIMVALLIQLIGSDGFADSKAQIGNSRQFIIESQQECSHYVLQYCLDYQDSLVKTYYIDLSEKWSEVPIDSFKAVAVGPADTNAFIYIDFDEKQTYLCAAYLSPKIRHDVLLHIDNTNSDNWLTRLQKGLYGRGFICSIRDSIIAYSNFDLNFSPDSVIIVKILPNNKWKELCGISGVINKRVSMNYDQFLFCTSKAAFTVSDSGGLLIAYDLESESLQNICDAGINNIIAGRKDRNSPVYLLKAGFIDYNLWVFCPGHKVVRLTNYPREQSVRDFELRPDGIHYFIDDSDNQGGWEELILRYSSADCNK